ncbi:Manganese-dependent inorganic pyrophosphatase [Giardia duodenalis]|nr:Manganese-dependent inorganic pyrophosphatase [Giardia intestinalis]|eukprot:XP_001709328.1 Manganese-dependent inorganic pyrophosphatase, putative [Giardia lamblia ATCC 50803]
MSTGGLFSSGVYSTNFAPNHKKHRSMEAADLVQEQPAPIVVIGRKNPNSDSILSAVAYAHLLQRLMPHRTITAAAAGPINAQASYVLKRFKTKSPEIILDITPRAQHFNKDQLVALTEDEPLSRALELYSIYKFHVLPVINSQDQCIGQIALTDMFSDFLRPHREGDLKSVITSLNTVKKTVRGRFLFSSSISNKSSSTPMRPGHDQIRRYNIITPVTVPEYFATQTSHFTPEDWQSCIFVVGHYPEVIDMIIRKGGGCIVLSRSSHVIVTASSLDSLVNDSDSSDDEFGDNDQDPRGSLSHSNLLATPSLSSSLMTPTIGAVNTGIRRNSSSSTLSSSRIFTEELINMLKQGKTSVILTNMAVSSAAILVKQSTPVGLYVNKSKHLIVPDTMMLSEIRKKFATTKERAVCVVDPSTNKLTGVVTDMDLTKKTLIEVVLVDHNDIGDSVQGIKSSGVDIIEIIDHHKLNNPTTPTPIKVTIDQVGSTCTIVTKMFRDNGIVPPVNIAGILLSGIICDTIGLRSQTTTISDKKMCDYLSQIVGVSRHELSQEIFTASSVLMNCQNKEKLVRSDILSFDFPNKREKKFAIAELQITQYDILSQGTLAELLSIAEKIKVHDKYQFVAILATNIDPKQSGWSSLIFYSGPDSLIAELGYTLFNGMDGIYESRDITSRKKQLLPHILSALSTLVLERDDL